MVIYPARPSVVRLELPKVAQYARFLMQHHLHDYVNDYRNAVISRNISVQDYFLPDGYSTSADRFRHWVEQHLELLASDNAGMLINDTLSVLFPDDNKTPGQLQVHSDIVFQLAGIQKKIFQQFLPAYTTHVAAAIEIIEELDHYHLAFEKSATEIYIQSLAQLLQLREEQLLEAQQLSGTGSYIWYMHQKAGHMTPEMMHLLQIKDAEDMLDHLQYIHQDDIEMVQSTFAAALAAHAPYELRYRFARGGQEKMILTKGKVVETASGPVIKGTVMDITEMGKNIRHLEESRQLYREAQELARIGNWSWDTGLNTVRWSDEAFQICQVPITTDSRLLPGLMKDFIYPKDWQAVKRQLNRMKKTGKQLFYIADIRLKSGEEKILEIKGKAIAGDQGRIVQVIGTVQDVTSEQGLIRKLQDTERRYRHMESIAHIGNWMIDIEKNEAQVTDEFLRIYDINPKVDAADMNAIRKHMNEQDRKEVDALIEQCKKDGLSYKYQCEITTANGALKTLMVRGEAVRDSSGKIYRIVGTAQDITKEQLLLAQLQRSEVLFKQAQTIGRIGNWVLDITSDQMEWSDEVFHLYELDRTVPDYNEKALELILPADRSVLLDGIEQCKQDGQPFTCRYRLQMKDGRIRHFRFNGEMLPPHFSFPRQMIGTIQDITEQILAEKQLRDQQHFTEKITDVAPSIIAVIDLETGRYAFISMAVETLLGYKREDILEKGSAFLYRYVHPDDLQLLIHENEAAINAANAADREGADGIAEFKYRIKHADGNYRWLQTSSTVFERDETGRVTQLLNVSIDISGEKQAEQILSYQNTLLQQSNSSLEEFAYIASHDLQEPLRKISTFGNMLETMQQEGLSDSGKLYIRKIVDSSIRMQAMINDLLSVSVISGNRSFRQEQLQDILDEVLVTLEYKMEQTQAVVEVREPLPPGNVVASQFRQLFQNLISNSLKFIRPGIRPVIRIDHALITDEAALAMGLDKNKQYLQIRFQDNGIGFSNTYAGKIFAIFQRLNGKSEYEGTGIGLAVCKKIVEHHNGIILGSGEPDNGALFTIVIPA